MNAIHVQWQEPLSCVTEMTQSVHSTNPSVTIIWRESSVSISRRTSRRARAEEDERHARTTPAGPVQGESATRELRKLLLVAAGTRP